MQHNKNTKKSEQIAKVSTSEKNISDSIWNVMDLLNSKVKFLVSSGSSLILSELSWFKEIAINNGFYQIIKKLFTNYC